MKNIKKYTRYELARLLSSRALQLSLGVVPQVKTKEMDPLKQAELEFEKDKIPFEVVK